MYADHLLLPWLEPLRAELTGLEALDVHTHIGANDPDTFHATAEELLAALDLAGARGVAFPMQEPDGYPAANDAVIAAAAASRGRLSAFCRLDPAAEPLAEAERCLAAGATGIKLHTRAERFALHDERLAGVFALAGERRLPVLVHAGRGIPALGEDAVVLCDRHPGLRLILAHAAISDLSWLAGEAASHPNLFFDLAWWSAPDLFTLLAFVPPAQVLFASDAPYGTPVVGLAMLHRLGRQAGLDDAQIRLVAGGQAARLISGEDPADGGRPPGPERIGYDVLLDRAYTFLVMALARGHRGQLEGALEGIELARLACQVPDDAPHAAHFRAIVRLLDEREAFAASGEEAGPFALPGLQLVVFASTVARTPDVPVPAALAG